jgi:hypothetical protein
MPVIAPAYITVNPHIMLPEIILPYSQASGAWNLLPTEEPRVLLGEDDQAAYLNRVDVRTAADSGQSIYNQMSSPDLVFSQISAATYWAQVRAEYNHHDVAAAARYNTALPNAFRLANQQAIVNVIRTALLYGMNPLAGEGLTNAVGADFLTLPPDSYGNDSVTTYDNGQMAFFLAQQVLQIKTRTNNLGIGRKFVFCGPQRTLGTFEYNIVQLVQFQRTGAGSTSTAGVTKEILSANADELIWCYDDTLIGKGSGGTDLVMIVMPEVAKPMQGDSWNTNRFASLAPGLEATTMQLVDMAAPREITVPLPGGAVDTLFEQKFTAGWPLRPEAICGVSMAYP